MSQEKMEINQNFKIIPNHQKETLLNTIGEIYSYSEEKLGKPIKPSELKVTLFHNYSFENNINDYKFEIKNNSFDPERDINKNEKFHKTKNEDFIFINEYSKKSIVIIKNIDLTPHLKKGITFQPKYFDFFQINEEKKKVKYEFKERIKDDIFFYSKYCNINLLYKIKEYIDYLGQNSFFLDKIVTIYQIFYLESMSQFETYQNLIEKKIIDYFSTKPEKFQIVFLLNNTNENKPINVFNNTYEKNSNLYYFIVDPSNKIISVKPLTNFFNNIERYFNKINEKNINEEINIIKTLKDYSKEYYLHNFKFSFEIKFTINDELTTITPTKILNIKVNGQLKTPQYNHLTQLDKKNNKYEINITEIQTFNIEINFSNLTCSNCKKEIKNNVGLYYCYWCNIQFCEDCFESNLTKNDYQNDKIHFIDRLIHKEHNLLYFKTRNKKDLENLDKSKIGSNKFATATSNVISYHHSAICNGCRCQGFENNEKKLRYVCVSCRSGIKIFGGYIDYCYNCFNDMRINNSKGRDIQNIIDDGAYNFNHNITNKHNHEKHVYFVLTCEVNGKYDDY